MSSRRFSPSLHLRLWLVIVLACLPVALMALADFRQQRLDAVTHLRGEVERMQVAARMAEDNAQRSLQQTFGVMARSDNLRALDPQDCSRLSERLLQTLTEFDDLGAALPDGRIFCSAQDFAGAQQASVADRPWFRRALAQSGPAAGEWVQSRLIGRQIMVFGHAVRDAAGRPIAVLFATRSLSRVDQRMHELQLPEGWNAFVLGGDNHLLSYYPAEQRPAAAPPEAAQAFWRASAKGGAIEQLRGFDGALRVYGVDTTRQTDPALLVAIGAPIERSLERIERGFMLRLALLAAIALVSALIARTYVHGLIEAWTERLAHALDALAAGRLDTRIAQLSPVPEFAGVERGINQMAAGLAQRESDLRRLSVAVEQSPAGMLITDTQARILYANPAAERMTGYTQDEMRGQRPYMLHQRPAEAAEHPALWQALHAGRVWSGEFTNARKDGSRYVQRTTISPIIDAQGRTTHYVAAMEDITARKESEALIHRLAYFDEITGLPNRARMYAQMTESIAAGAQAGGCALLLFDVDRFKQVNDTWGHAAGDALLRLVAQRIQASVGARAQCARLGSNTFGVLACGLGAGGAQTALALALAAQVRLALADPYALADGQRLYASTSAGVALSTPQTDSAELLLKQAEVALYRAKAGGGGALLLFDTAMQADVDARAQLEMGLRAALEEGGFALHYQAQVGPGGRVQGAEALLRWSAADGQPISPARFIPLAEETGLIVPLGRWVLATACRQLARWQARPATRHLRLSVNVSARQFHQAEFVDMVRETLHASGADAHGLTLELTESAILGGIDATVARMHALRALGLRFALDDFGTGYSSLSYLQRLPFDELKIDQSFIRAMLVDPTSSAIVRAVLALGQTMGLQVVAEGVESAEHHDALTRQHCHHAQGYWFGRPMAIETWEGAHLGTPPSSE